MPTLAPADIRLKSSLHSSSGKVRVASATGLGSIEEAVRDERGKAVRDEQQRLFSTPEIHSPKPASCAASADLSTAVETAVETRKSPA
jgi:hypothetical protein